MEDIVDILTLKDNMESIDDYAMALYVLARVRVCQNAIHFEVLELTTALCQNLPEGRRMSACQVVWRRAHQGQE